MGKMIGKISKKDWSVAPEGATHTFRHKYEDAHQKDGYYKLKDGKIYYWRTGGDWWDATTHSHLELAVYCVPKEEDLEMDKKEIRSVADLEVGMFIKGTDNTIRVIIAIVGNKIKTCTFSMSTVILDTCRVTDYLDWREVVDSWSYTYAGEYTPIVKETEAERKIKELEATIALAQKQLQEYKGIK